jgi:hypothetical protein
MADGNIVYQGQAADSADYFRSLNFEFRKLANPADVFMRILSVNYPKQAEDE